MTTPARTHPDGSRELAPHIWQSPERLSGAPALTGHRISTKAIYGYWLAGTDWPAIQEDYYITGTEFIAAVAFEAGRAWQREQDAARKRARAARRGERGRQATEGRTE